MSKPSTRKGTAAHHAITLATLSPGVASKRINKLATANPAQALVMLSHLVAEKSFAFAQSYANSFSALWSAQLAFLRLASGSSTQHSAATTHAATSLALSSSNAIARAALAPLAQRVRRNSAR